MIQLDCRRYAVVAIIAHHRSHVFECNKQQNKTTSSLKSHSGREARAFRQAYSLQPEPSLSLRLFVPLLNFIKWSRYHRSR
jgi:hypothetical protein